MLSIRLSPALRWCEYRLEQRVDGEFPEGDHRAEILPIDQNAVLEFNAHRLLGVPANAVLHPGLNNPVVVNLSVQVEQLRRSMAAPRERPI